MDTLFESPDKQLSSALGRETPHYVYFKPAISGTIPNSWYYEITRVEDLAEQDWREKVRIRYVKLAEEREYNFECASKGILRVEKSGKHKGEVYQTFYDEKYDRFTKSYISDLGHDNGLFYHFPEPEPKKEDQEEKPKHKSSPFEVKLKPVVPKKSKKSVKKSYTWKNFETVVCHRK